MRRDTPRYREIASEEYSELEEALEQLEQKRERVSQLVVEAEDSKEAQELCSLSDGKSPGMKGLYRSDREPPVSSV